MTKDEMRKQLEDAMANFKGEVIKVDEGVSGRKKNYFCFEELSGKAKTFYRCDEQRAINYCKKFWTGGNWQVVEFTGRFVKDGDKVVARNL
jgi:hypothetical protein